MAGISEPCLLAVRVSLKLQCLLVRCLHVLGYQGCMGLIEPKGHGEREEAGPSELCTQRPGILLFHLVMAGLPIYP